MAGAVVGALALKADLWVGIAVSAVLSAVVTLLGHLRHRRDVKDAVTGNVGEAALR